MLDSAKTLPISIIPLAFVAICLPSFALPHYYIFMSIYYEILFTSFLGHLKLHWYLERILSINDFVYGGNFWGDILCYCATVDLIPSKVPHV